MEFSMNAFNVLSVLTGLLIVCGSIAMVVITVQHRNNHSGPGDAIAISAIIYGALTLAGILAISTQSEGCTDSGIYRLKMAQIQTEQLELENQFMASKLELLEQNGVLNADDLSEVIQRNIPE